jgi:hypothetical protein
MRQTVEALNELVHGLRHQATQALAHKDQIHCKLHAVELAYERARELIKRLQVKLKDERDARKEAQSLFRKEVINHSFRKRDNNNNIRH